MDEDLQLFVNSNPQAAQVLPAESTLLNFILSEIIYAKVNPAFDKVT